MVRATLGPRRPNVNFIEQTIKYFYTEDISTYISTRVSINEV